MNIRLKPVLAVDYQAISEVNAPDHYHQTTQPEHRLLWAILERAVYDAIGKTGAVEFSSHYMQDAYAWIMYPRWLKDFHEFSFDAICEELELNPLIIRKFVAVQCKKPKHEQVCRNRRINILNGYRPRQKE